MHVFRRTALIGAVALSIAGLAALGWHRFGFQPGGGGARELPAEVTPQGDVTLRLRLNVWGGGGIDGRYTGVMLRARVSGAASFLVVPGTLTKQEPAAASYEFRLSREALGGSGPLEYAFDVVLDGEPTRIAGKAVITVP